MMLGKNSLWVANLGMNGSSWGEGTRGRIGGEVRNPKAIELGVWWFGEEWDNLWSWTLRPCWLDQGERVLGKRGASHWKEMERLVSLLGEEGVGIGSYWMGLEETWMRWDWWNLDVWPNANLSSSSGAIPSYRCDIWLGQDLGMEQLTFFNVFIDFMGIYIF